MFEFINFIACLGGAYCLVTSIVGLKKYGINYILEPEESEEE